MARRPRPDVREGLVHVCNRAVRGGLLFLHERDYLAFTRLMVRELLPAGLDVVAWSLLPNHWHLLLRVVIPGSLGVGMSRLTAAHARAVHARHRTRGRGHVYQGRYHAVVIVDTKHARRACAYVERNPIAARLVTRVRDWRWSSVASPLLVPLDESFVREPDWTALLDRPLTEREEWKLERAALAKWP